MDKNQPKQRSGHALNDYGDPLTLLATRRSTLASCLGKPGPSDAQLKQILQVGIRVPDHGKLAPWRFILFRECAREAIGAVLEARYRTLNPDAKETMLAFERNRFMRAPVVVAVVSTAMTHPKIPQWEQLLSAGAVCQNILIAATAMEFGVQWITEWCAYDPEITQAMGLGKSEKIAGFIYLGTANGVVTERARPDLNALIIEYGRK
ncbi:MAG: nitroreductase [Hyphomicrobiales bacterium]